MPRCSGNSSTVFHMPGHRASSSRIVSHPNSPVNTYANTLKATAASTIRSHRPVRAASSTLNAMPHQPEMADTSRPTL